MSGIAPKKFYDTLLEKDIDFVYHANSVATSCLFLKKNSLISRGSIQRKGRKQTPQRTDSIDKRYGIWFDVFLDSVDIHKRGNALNKYGPVTFVISSELLVKTLTGRIWATKLNPTKWAGLQEKSRWFQNIEELQEDFQKGTFDHMIVLRHCGGELPLGNYLEKIILDDPEIITKKNIDIYSLAYGALRSAMIDGDLNVPIERRVCRKGCSCVKEYGDAPDFWKLMFDPMVIDI